MTDLINDIKQQIHDSVAQALCKIGADENTEIEIEVPKEKAHGDFSVNTAMKLTKILKKNPREIAAQITDAMDFADTYIEKAEIAGPGFINFYLKKEWLADGL